MASRRQLEPIALDEVDRLLINRLQDGLSLVSEPFAEIAVQLGCDVDDVLRRIDRLLTAGVLTRFGPFYDAAAMGGAFCLCAMAVPQDRFDEIADVVNGFDEVAHNYARDHDLNMWFVLATETELQIVETARAIEAATGLEVLLFPKDEEFFIGFRVAA